MIFLNHQFNPSVFSSQDIKILKYERLRHWLKKLRWIWSSTGLKTLNLFLCGGKVERLCQRRWNFLYTYCCKQTFKFINNVFLVCKSFKKSTLNNLNCVHCVCLGVSLFLQTCVLFSYFSLRGCREWWRWRQLRQAETDRGRPWGKSMPEPWSCCSLIGSCGRILVCDWRR